jgi:hypothetical protein
VWGSGCIDPHFLDLGTSLGWVVIFTPRPLYPRYPLYRRSGEPQSRCGRCGEENILVPAGTRSPTLGRPARSQSLYRLRYPGSSLFFLKGKNCLVRLPCSKCVYIYVRFQLSNQLIDLHETWYESYAMGDHPTFLVCYSQWQYCKLSDFELGSPLGPVNLQSRNEVW